MAEPRFHVARSEIELGEFSRSEIVELTEAGFLLPDDQCWTDGQSARKTLAAVIGPGSQDSKPMIERAAIATAGMASALRSHVFSIGEKVISSTRRQAASVSDTADRLLECSLPSLQQRVADVLRRSMKSTSATLRDEVFLRKLFGAVYDTLPRPFYRFVSEEAFLAFCFKHQRRLLPSQHPSASATPSSLP